jgi:hypothetical protein
MNGIDPRQLRGQFLSQELTAAAECFLPVRKETPMIELRNRVVEVDAPLPMAGPGEVRVRVPGATP